MAETIALTKENYNNLLKAERQLTDLLPTIDKLEQCGEACDVAREMINQQLARMAALKKNFAPNLLTQ